jgi:hypothetical protein
VKIEVELGGLRPDTRYYYRMRYRRTGAGQLGASPERTFHTQRAHGQAFVFVVQSDPHLIGHVTAARQQALALYRRTLANELASGPDFMIDLGDTFHTQYFAGRDARDLDEAFDRHLHHRAYFDLIGHSVPIFLVAGNHEGEQGWRLDGTPDNVAVWATLARKRLYPNPVPDRFYAGLSTPFEFVGKRERIFAWEWGDALFVALDPYWYTTRNPHPRRTAAGRPDPWAWTLGESQYQWLRAVLENSRAHFKLVFAHQVTGGLDPESPYGRGGVRAARHALGGEGSYEWGGEAADGTLEFHSRRPGWHKPVHDLMVDNNVTVFFHGHDHCYARESLDHIVYQGVPVPSDETYGLGFCGNRRYYGGADVMPNSGHLKVTVTSTRVTVDYVRTTHDPADLSGPPLASYTLEDCNENGTVDSKEIEIDPSLDRDRDMRIDGCMSVNATRR